MLIFERVKERGYIFCILYFSEKLNKKFLSFYFFLVLLLGKGVGKGGERQVYVKFNIEIGWLINLKNINLCNLCGGSSMFWGG